MKRLVSWVCGICILTLAMGLLPLTGFIQTSPALAYAQQPPDAAFIPGIVGHPQTFGLSCESRSAVDLAAYWGVTIGEWEFLSALPVTDNPDTGFVGSYNGWWGAIPPASYGVHARPVAALLRQYGLQVKARRGLSWDELRSEIAGGRPVIVWIIGQMWSGTPIEYTASDGHQTTVARFEHTMLVSGYDQTYLYAIDAYSGANMTFYHSTFLDSWSVLGNMAVTGFGPDAPPTPTQVPSQAGNGQNSGRGSYTVQRGDYLIALAERFGVPWQELARLNAIGYPYVIYPGQELVLPGQLAVITNQVYLPLMQRRPRLTPALTPTPLPAGER